MLLISLSLPWQSPCSLEHMEAEFVGSLSLEDPEMCVVWVRKHPVQLTGFSAIRCMLCRLYIGGSLQTETCVAYSMCRLTLGSHMSSYKAFKDSLEDL